MHPAFALSRHKWSVPSAITKLLDHIVVKRTPFEVSYAIYEQQEHRLRRNVDCKLDTFLDYGWMEEWVGRQAHVRHQI